MRDFRDERGWKKYHRPKDLAISLTLETAEFLDHFKWKTDSEMRAYLKSAKGKEVAEELSDVLHNVLLIAEEFEIDLEREFEAKMKKNEKKYPIK
ncbi:MAG: Nucleotide pyrophosphohydrolase [Candidatus Curtissbacteria bacterium GW2011_GWA1_40_16]|uniref:Nucleotide pyrophosphohydrolase n=1 Tax=Candidatus Curtissbacteria bacterium GW2011_GWA1_40_16 TaxID=1618405 RepID=A0A0G0RMR4_9BACT|nr:MAG: Nucleotide pyrophosphohydrolase [Candidatus Curtissbacteria bacterium GW2011_GWA1_40_16]